MQIHWLNPERVDERERSRLEARLHHMADGNKELMEVRVAIHPNGHHRHGGMEVRITAHLRGKTLVASRERPDLGAALHDSLDVLESEIRRLLDKRTDRRGPPHHGQEELPSAD